MSDVIKCPKCESTNWRCVDERNHYYAGADGEIFELPVGYLACRDCGARFQHHDEYVDAEYIGDDRDLDSYLSRRYRL